MMILRSCGTHDGSFHADEVTACALLILFGLIDKERIVRTRDPLKLSQCEFVCDVGGIYDPQLKRFDHHQSEYTGELSSAGMVWLYLKERRIVTEELYQFFNRSLILGVDAHDNGRVTTEVGSCTFSHVVSNFVPTLYDAPQDVQNNAFFQALDFVIGHLKRLLEKFHYIESCRAKVIASMKQGEKYLLFDEALPWIECFFDEGGKEHPALFIIMPAGEHWKLRAIPPSMEERMKVRSPLPLEWAGLLDEDLKRVSGIPGAIFCHKGRFVSVWEKKEDALQALQWVLKRISP